MNPYNLSALCFSFCSLFVGLLIWLKRDDAVGKSYFCFSFAASSWAFAFAILISNNVSDEIALTASRIANISGLVVAVAWFHFAAIFSGTVQQNKNRLILCYAAFAVIVSVSFSPLFVAGVSPKLTFNHYTEPGPIYHLFTFIFFTMVPLGFIELIKKLRRSTGIERTQCLGFIWSTAIGYAGGSLTFLPVYDISMPQYGIFITPFYPFVMAYFLIRKNMFDEKEMAVAIHRDKLAAIGTLTSSLHHEIKSPLYVIQGIGESFLSNLNEGVAGDGAVLKEQAKEMAEKVTAQARRAYEIMKTFSSFSKKTIEGEGRQTVVSIQQIIDDTLPLIRPDLELRKINMQIDVPGKPLLVKADHRQLQQILFNLIVNACQALKGNEGCIRINVQGKADTIKLTVKDDGPGISQEQQRQLFKPFYTTKTDGTGLGLYITKQLVENNGGTISLQSEEGKGAEVHLEFPKA